ncbi:MAG: PQQ-binding-like beta-propeller repeat protein [Bryobacteraceae bacterium]
MKSNAIIFYPFLALTLFAQAPTPPPSFNATVRPFLEKNCQKCHNGKLQSGDINFEVLKYSNSLGPQAQIWETTSYALKMGQMPPEGSPRPEKDQVDSVIAVLEKDLAKAKEAPAAKAAPPTREWLTWQGDPERTGWAKAETTLAKDNISGLSLLWKSQLDAVPSKVNAYSTLTDPLIAENVPTKQGLKKLVYVASAENNVYALDANTGAQFWERKFPTDVKPPQPASGMCPNNLNATPVIDKQNGIIYVLMNDGKLRGLGLADGDDRMAPTDFTAPYSRNWSLNLMNGMVYTSSSRGCGGAISVISAMDVTRPSHAVARFYPSTGKASGPWGRGGIVHTPTGVVAQTADGVYDPASGRFGNTFVGLTKDLRLNDSYTPANYDYLNSKDFDLGSASPTVFSFGKWTLVAGAAKEGVVYLLDAANLGGANHQTPLYVSPRYGNDALLFGFNGVWGALSTWVDAKGERWVLVPMSGPPAKDTAPSFKYSYGPVLNGSVMAFQVKVQKGKPVLVPMWISHDLDLPGMPVAANGVVYALASGDRASDAFRGPRPPPGQSRPGGPPRGGGGLFGGPPNQVNVGEPGADRDAAWLSAQREPGGQTPGRRFTGGRDTTHAVLYALDGETGKELYSSKDLIDSWNHYGGLSLSDGKLYVSTYDGRVYAFGLSK